MLEFIHISDLHINNNDDYNNKIHSKLIQINKLYPNAYYIISGDITDNGDILEYDNANFMFDFIKDKIIITAGNHDYGTLGNFYQIEHEKNYKLFADIYKLHLIDADNKIMIIGLDSNLRTITPFDFACGEIGEKQLMYLNSFLTGEKFKDYKKIVYLHHHPFMHTDKTMKLNDSNALMPLISNSINALLFGHKHEQQLWVGYKDDKGNVSNYGIDIIHCAGRFSKENRILKINIDKDNFNFDYFSI